MLDFDVLWNAESGQRMRFLFMDGTVYEYIHSGFTLDVPFTVSVESVDGNIRRFRLSTVASLSLIESLE